MKNNDKTKKRAVCAVRFYYVAFPVREGIINNVFAQLQNIA